MKIKHFISSLLLSASLVTAGALFASQEKVEKAEAAGDTQVTKIVIKDSAGWLFRTLWLESFSFSSGYSSTELKDFIKDYYVNSYDSWNKQGTTKGYHEYNGNYNLCAGGSSGTYTFILPVWVTTCKVTVENNDNSRYMNYLDNLYKYSNNTGGGYNTGGVGKTITLETFNWGNTSSVGSAATESSFNTTVNWYYKSSSETIDSGSVSMSKYDLLPSNIPFGYDDEGWFSDSTMQTQHNSKLPLSDTTLYRKLSAKKEAYLAFESNGWKANDDNYLLAPGSDSQYTITISLPKDDEFKVVYKGTWYGWGDVDQSSKLVTSGTISLAPDTDGNIKLNSATTLEIYFKTTAGSNRIWIQQDSQSEAEVYATAFLAAITCTSDSPTFALNVWNKVGSETTSMEYKYEQLTEGAKGKLAVADPNQGGTVIEQCAARYDRILSKYGYGTATGQRHDFMGRKPSLIAGRSLIAISSIANSSTVIVTVVIAGVAALAVGGYFLLRKKKDN